MTARERGRVVAIVICIVLIPTRLLAEPSVYYVYDELNRLIVVVDEQGSAATYTYDAVGNIVGIDRVETNTIPGAVAISTFAPTAGAVGTTVQVFGRGFGTTIAQNSLTFGGDRRRGTEPARRHRAGRRPHRAARGHDAARVSDVRARLPRARSARNHARDRDADRARPCRVFCERGRRAPHERAVGGQRSARWRSTDRHDRRRRRLYGARNGAGADGHDDYGDAPRRRQSERFRHGHGA